MTKIRLDFDSPDYPDMRRIYAACRILYLPIDNVKIARSRHDGWHVTVTLADTLTSPVYITCLQAIMGSDWKRESFNLIRAEAIENMKLKDNYLAKNWNILFEADESS